MSERTTSTDTDPNSVRKVVRVQAPLEVAWRVFTQQMGTWWPLENYKIGQSKAVDAVVEPRAGGRWFERGADGSTCDWGTVLIWEPPARLERFGARRDEMRRIFDKEGDWGRVLEMFARVAATRAGA